MCVPDQQSQSASNFFYSQTIKKIIVFSDFLYKPGAAKDLFDKFVKILETTVGVYPTMVCLEDIWKHENPASDGRSLADYIGKVRSTSV